MLFNAALLLTFAFAAIYLVGQWLFDEDFRD